MGTKNGKVRQNRNKEAKKWKHIPLKLSFLSQDPFLSRSIPWLEQKSCGAHGEYRPKAFFGNLKTIFFGMTLR
jgi:hypothetical protein